MKDTRASLHRHRGIAFVGNYLPRNCGIATFTHDLAEAVAQQCEPSQPVLIAAMNDIPEGYAYPNRVRFEMRQNFLVDYTRAADFLNFSRINVVSLQHEYGIFGGKWGANILTVLRNIRCPIVVTCHTVLKDPKPEQREVFIEIAGLASKLVVMSERAVEFLETAYNIPKAKIALIPHGIHDTPFVDPAYFKDKFGLEGRRVLLTFGLLGSNKGIKYMIEALPAIVKKHPKTTYLVLGATHLAILKLEGESYRLGLQRQVRELGIEDHVLFHPRFVDLDELLEYLGATDIFVTPYLNLDQITSGALAYAMGAGKAVVSTPYWHAEELLANGRGRLVPPEDPSALSREIIALLDDEVELAAMRKRAYLHCRSMTWASVARSYLQLFDEVRSHAVFTVPVATSMTRPLSATNLPAPKLDHLERLGDDIGLSHHARGPLPNFTYGYWLEDAAAGLVAVLKYHDMFGVPEAAKLSVKYLTLLQHLIGDGKAVAGLMSYDRRRGDDASDMAIGKAIWGVGYAVDHGPTLLHGVSMDLFNQLLAEVSITTPRGMAYSILGASNCLRHFPGAFAVKRFLKSLVKPLTVALDADDWIDRWDGADWGVAPQALTVAATNLEDNNLFEHALKLVAHLRELTSEGTRFEKRNDNPDAEELPISVMAFIEALGAVFHKNRDRELLDPIRAAADWFLGANKRGESLYDFNSGGCHDALTASGLNDNQGTEATVSCLIAFLTLHRLAAYDVELTIPNLDPSY